MEKLSKGDKAVCDGHFLEAALFYSEEMGSKDGRPILFYKRAKCLLQLNHLDLALKDIEKAIELDPDEIVYRYRLVDCYLKMADTDKAEEIISVIKKKFTSFSKTVNLKKTQIKNLQAFKNHTFEASIEANEKFLKLLNREVLKISPACPDYKFLKMRTLVILKKVHEIDESLNESRMLDTLIAYYEGDIEKSTQLVSSMPEKQAQSVENFKKQVREYEEMKTGM